MTAIDRIKQLVDAGHLHPHIQQTFPLSEIATAISTSMGGQVIGKLAISVVGSEPEAAAEDAAEPEEIRIEFGEPQFMGPVDFPDGFRLGVNQSTGKQDMFNSIDGKTVFGQWSCEFAAARSHPQRSLRAGCADNPCCVCGQTGRGTARLAEETPTRSLRPMTPARLGEASTAYCVSNHLLPQQDATGPFALTRAGFALRHAAERSRQLPRRVYPGGVPIHRTSKPNTSLPGLAQRRCAR